MTLYSEVWGNLIWIILQLILEIHKFVLIDPNIIYKSDCFHSIQATFYSCLHFKNLFFDPENILQKKEMISKEFSSRLLNIKTTCDEIWESDPGFQKINSDPENWRDLMYYNFRHGYLWCTVHKVIHITMPWNHKFMSASNQNYFYWKSKNKKQNNLPYLHFKSLTHIVNIS